MRSFFDKYPVADKVIAAGVSGGADSLALVLRLKEWGDANDKKIVALTVDHGLRSEAAAEAAYVAEVMQRFGIEHHILRWEGEKPVHGIEEAAREARYGLIAAWCREAGVRVLATGHHRRDQAETFLLRLIRGSGVSGLSGILPVSERLGLMIIRPQLFDAPDDLKIYLERCGVAWVEDPSNRNEDFLRVKIRNYLPVLSAELGLTEERLAATAGILEKTRSFLDSEVAKFVKNHCRFWEKCGCSFAESVFFTLHEELQYRVLTQLFKQIGGKAYAPEAREVLRVAGLVRSGSFNGCTLGGCMVILRYDRLWIVREGRKARKISRREWDDYVAAHPQYGRLRLPYKLKCLLAGEECGNRA